MSMIIKLKPVGSKKNKSYRIIVTNKKSGFGNIISQIGTYKIENSNKIVYIKKSEFITWILRGVKLSPSVQKILKI